MSFINLANLPYACMISLSHHKEGDGVFAAKGLEERERERMVLLENTDSIEHSARGRRSMETDSLF